RRDPPVPRAALARRQRRPRPARGPGDRAHLRGSARAHVRLRARGRGPARVRAPARVVRGGAGGVFTGLIADLGTVAAVELDGAGARINVRTALAGELREGDSIAVSG